MWFGMRRAPAAIAVRRSNRSRRLGSRSAKCSTFPSARSWLRNIRPRSSAARIAAARRRRRFPWKWSRGDLSQYPATHTRGSDRASSERSFRRAADLPGQHRGLVRKKGEDLRQVYARIGERVAKVKVRHLGETGFRIAGKLQWLHTTSSPTSPSIAPVKSAARSLRICKGGAVVHDHFLPIAGSTRSTTPSATPISCANSRA